MEYSEVPINFDKVTKHLDFSESEKTPERAAEVAKLNKLYKDLVGVNSDVPPPPNQINGRLTDQVKKLKESGNQAFKRSSYADAIRMYGLAIEMALKRASWEASGYQREELSVLFSNRSQAYMSTGSWGEGMVDADTAIFLRRSFPKAHYRKGKCLQNLGRLREAKDAYELGLESGGTDGSVAELKNALADVEELLFKK
ncbi:uncharacterized protein V2V93DRAFT_368431 [Kockiozyma suomiensis]|uniref:uncharacterized protein n=1 Tax=Kockiozyma suomiensis TaxID=1337062 RepID=UPI003343B7B9